MSKTFFDIFGGRLIRHKLPAASGVTKIIAGTGITISPPSGVGIVTISATGAAGVELNIYIKEFLKNAGSENMNVNGSVTPVTFEFVADGTLDTFIEEIIIRLEDGSIDFKTFGNLAALSTGIDLFVDQTPGTATVIDKAKTIYEIIHPCQAEFDLIEKKSGDNEAILMRIKLNKLKLAGGTSNKIRMVVNDDLTTLNKFTAKVIGGRS